MMFAVWLTNGLQHLANFGLTIHPPLPFERDSTLSISVRLIDVKGTVVQREIEFER